MLGKEMARLNRCAISLPNILPVVLRMRLIREHSVLSTPSLLGHILQRGKGRAVREVGVDHSPRHFLVLRG